MIVKISKQVSKQVSKHMALCALGTLVLLSACATTPPPRLVGAAAVTGPPQMAIDRDGISSWANAAAFGAIPPELAQRGDDLCNGVNARRAIGYHPDARDAKGRPLPGGGFFCSNG